VAKKVPNPIDVHVGSRVRLRRMLVGMSQERLGELLGLTFQQVQKYEKGTNRIGASRLFQIAQYLGVPVQFFFEDIAGSMVPAGTAGASGFGEIDGAPYVMEFVSSQEGLELNRSYTRILDPRVRKKILELVRCLGGEPPTEERAPTRGRGHEQSDENDSDDGEEGLETQAAAKHA